MYKLEMVIKTKKHGNNTYILERETKQELENFKSTLEAICSHSNGNVILKTKYITEFPDKPIVYLYKTNICVTLVSERNIPVVGDILLQNKPKPDVTISKNYDGSFSHITFSAPQTSPQVLLVEQVIDDLQIYLNMSLESETLSEIVKERLITQ